MRDKRAVSWKGFVACVLFLSLLWGMFCIYVSARVEKTLEQVISEGFYGFEERIDISSFSLTPEELSHSFSCVIKDDPYLFFVSRNLRYSYDAQGRVCSLMPQYTMTAEEYAEARAYCAARVWAMASLAEHFESEAERALLLHDLICERFEYDRELKNDDIYEFLLTGRGTCEAYMLLYTAVLRECGIEAHFAASDTLAHIWNVIRIDGEWYHADLTWDDSASEDGVSRRHFLCSDRAAEQRGHKGWYSPKRVACTSEKYDGFDFCVLLQKRVDSGDLDHDGEISLLDLLILRGRQGDKMGIDICCFCADADLDGAISEADMDILRKKLTEDD